MGNSPLVNDEWCPDVTGVILAGGRSVRMGRDKATLKVAGVTLFERTLKLLRHFFPAVIISGPRPDLARPDVPFFPDPFPGSALGGLYTGLLNAQTPWIFVIPCDLPFADPAIVHALLQRRNDWEAVIPKTSSGIEPLFGLYRKPCLPLIRHQLEEGRYRIVDIYDKIRIRYVGEEELPPSWRNSLRNLNCPEEYRKLCGKKV